MEKIIIYAIQAWLLMGNMQQTQNSELAFHEVNISMILNLTLPCERGLI